MVVNSNFTGVLKKFSGTLWYLVKFGCVTHCVMEYFGDFVFCTGPSMEPTIYTNNVVISDQMSVWMKRIDKGDIVIAKLPHDRNQLICKRVTGLPGDRVWAGYSYQKYGPIPQGLLRGKVICRIWPLNDLKIFS
ncbi:mitochondrial inner membrane protease subunit 1-like [Diaphorina citri]|uniref:Mitochondrial inner membrane protease subunit n=1 Tax=Diaphorina citri TaxID=121845 RepID=A0A1S4EF71_DIACI|nr:mitochondrial inner membrane protease subunit 1-like [Diaphorina citri]